MPNWFVWNRTVYLYKNGFGIKVKSPKADYNPRILQYDNNSVKGIYEIFFINSNISSWN